MLIFDHFCVFDGTVLFRMCELVVEDDFRFATFTRFHHVIALQRFRRAERLLGRPDRLEKDGTFFQKGKNDHNMVKKWEFHKF